MSVYALSDIHGNGILWNKIKNYLKPDDKIFFLGDAIDRGPDGYKIMKEIFLDSRFMYLKGNHEDMMMKALEEIESYENDYNFDLWTVYNGGYVTYDAWIKENHKFSGDWIDTLRQLPLEATYINKNNKTVLLSHAGYTPGHKTTDEYNFIWNRSHFYMDTEDISKDIIVVHGHTPIDYLKVHLPKEEWIDNNGVLFYKDIKINIDCGTYRSKYICLLNLDTLEVIQFEE